MRQASPCLQVCLSHIRQIATTAYEHSLSPSLSHRPTHRVVSDWQGCTVELYHSCCWSITVSSHLERVLIKNLNPAALFHSLSWKAFLTVFLHQCYYYYFPCLHLIADVLASACIEHFSICRGHWKDLTMKRHKVVGSCALSVPFQDCSTSSTQGCSSCFTTNEGQLLHKYMVAETILFIALWWRLYLALTVYNKDPIVLLPLTISYVILTLRWPSCACHFLLEKNRLKTYLVTLHFSSHSSHLVYGDVILSRARQGKAQTICPFIQLESVAEQIAGKFSLLSLDLCSHNQDGKRRDCDITRSSTESLVELLDCTKGHYISLRPTGSACTHWKMSE